ncbi:MAG: MBL fold metallo-hydrolase [Desulfuromonadales bacterium]|nr:MBL fold metallo-hydrolase [Desulfuromonadales bacterium]
MIIETVPVGALQVNSYILGCETSHEGVVIDAGGSVDRLLARIDKLGLTIRYLLDTHGHFDHVGGNRAFLQATGATFLIHEKDAFLLSMAKDAGRSFGVTVENSPEPDSFLTDGMVIEFGSYRLRIIHTPGHSPGGCCIYSAETGDLFTGDTLFNGSVGRTDLPGGSMEVLVRSIRERLAILPETTRIYPGHGPSSTIAIELFTNPFLRRG